MAGSTPHLVELRGTLGLRDAGDLAARLGAAIEANVAVVLSANDLTGIDISILQVLLSAHKSATAAGRSLTFASPAGGVLRQTLIRAGLLGPSGEPTAAEGEFWTGTAGRSKGLAA